MFEDSTTPCLLFPEIFEKPAVLQFDQQNGSSDGGAILLKAADRRYGLIQALAGCLRDKRQAGKVDHSLRELMSQRVFSIACGYPDANDSARLSADPIHKMLLDRDPVTGRDLASQPTLSRFENSIRPRELYRLGEALADSVIDRHAKRLRGHARLVTIDLDPTDDPIHGAQQLSFFNGHYDSWCYLPVMGFVSFNDEAEQYLCAAVLRPGNVTAAVGAKGILRRLINMISFCFPGARIRVRLDGGFAHPNLLYFLEGEPNLEYVIAMAKNAVLKRKAKPAMRKARRLSRQSGETEHLYGEANYAARTWPQQRRIIIKAEVVRAEGKTPKDNPRFVITNMKQSPQWLYEEVYCQRGEIENRIKELHDLQIDRTSCSDFWANQLRVLLTAAAYVLMQELRLQAAHTSCARAQVWTLRERLLKHIEPTCDEILEEFKGSVADALKLGHGAALTDPDLPFLKWNYKNSYRQEQDRDNPAIFSLAAARLFAQFQYYLGVTNQKSMLAQDLNAINDTIKQNVSTDAGARHQRWLALVKAGVFSFGPLSDQETDELGYAADGPGSWKYAALGTSDEPKSPVPYDQNFDSSNWKRFHDALKDHQHEVLNQILPRYGLPSSIQGSI